MTLTRIPPTLGTLRSTLCAIERAFHGALTSALPLLRDPVTAKEAQAALALSPERMAASLESTIEAVEEDVL